MKPRKKSSNHERKAFWSKHVKAYSSSGLTQRAYCRKNKLSYWTFNSWKNKLDKAKSETEFIKLPATIKPFSTTDNTDSSYSNNFEIILKNGLTIKIPANFDPALFQQIIKLAGGISC